MSCCLQGEEQGDLWKEGRGRQVNQSFIYFFRTTLHRGGAKLDPELEEEEGFVGARENRDPPL